MMGPGKVGDNFTLSLTPDSEAEATRIFNALTAGGQVTMPLAKAFWGSFFGMGVDKFGIHWMVNYEYPK
jgi:PhnB protein